MSFDDAGEAQVLEEAAVTITLETEGHYVTLGDLARAAGDLSELVTSVAGDLGEETETTLNDDQHWAVSNMRVGSAVLTVAPLVPRLEAKSAQEVMGTILGGLRKLEAGAEDRPEHFPDQALYAARHLVGMLNDGVTRITLRSGNEVIELSQRVQATVDALVRGVNEVLGSVEGRLEGLTVHGTRQASLYQSGTNRRIECRFPPELLKDMIEGFTHRVQVIGLIRYTRRGEPASVQVERVRRLRDRREGPSIADLAGIDPDFTGGLSPEEYLERLRDGG
jgi:hypothetical protein